MSIERFFLDGYRNEEHYEFLQGHLTFPLVRELEFKYGLKISHLTYVNDQKHSHWENNIPAWLMCHKNGIAVGKVFVVKTPEGKDEYCWRSPFYKKERGENNADRETIRSIKISSLMATLTRQKVIPDAQSMEFRKIKQIEDAIRYVRSSFGRNHKSMSGWDPNEMHALLLMALGKSPNSEWVKVDQNKCQETLDLFEKADTVTKEQMKESERFFMNPFFMVGVDAFGDYIIGKFKLHSTKEFGVEYEVIEPFKRYRSYEDVPDLIPVMTMTKLAYEGKDFRTYGVLPQKDEYDPNLDAVFFYANQPTHYDHLFMVTPCPM